MKHVYTLFTALLVAVPVVKAEVPSSVAIKDAHVVTVSGEDLPKATVVVKDGLDPGGRGECQIPPGPG